MSQMTSLQTLMLIGIRDLLCNKPYFEYPHGCATLSGSIPDLANLRTLLIVGENFEGTLPRFFDEKARSLLVISGASIDWINPRTMSGTLPAAWNDKPGSLLSLVLMNVRISGTIPHMHNQPELQQLNVVKELVMPDPGQTVTGIPNWFNHPTLVGEVPDFSSTRNPALQQFAIIGHAVSGATILVFSG